MVFYIKITIWLADLEIHSYIHDDGFIDCQNAIEAAQDLLTSMANVMQIEILENGDCTPIKLLS